MFNSSLTDMKRNMASGQGTMYSIFAGGKLKQNDVTAITNYANAVKAGVKPTQAFKDNLGGCSVAAKRYVVDARRAGKSTDEMVTGLSKVPKATSAASIGLKALSVAGNMLLSMGIMYAISGLIQGITWLATSSERAKEAAEELANELNTQKETIEGNISTIKGLEDEFKRLSKGVDDYGANVSLSADEYERYQQIVQQIVGISPNLIAGYDKEGNAIANKNGLIEQSIALLKEENRQRIANATSEETVRTLGKGEVEKYKDKEQEVQNKRRENSFWVSGNWAQAENKNEKLLELIGINDKKPWWLNDNSFYGDKLRDNYDVLFQNFDKIIAYNDELKKMGQPTLLSDDEIKRLQNWAKVYGETEAELERASKTLNPTLQMVPQSLTVYDELTDKQKAFVSEYINTFRITADTTEADIEKMRQDILDFTEAIGNASPETKKAIEDLFSLDKTKMSATEWGKQVNDLINQIVNSLTFDNDEEKNNFVKNLKIRLGIEFTTDGETTVDTLISNVKEKFKGKFENEIGQLSIDELKILSNLDISPEGIESWSEVETLIANAGKEVNEMTVSLSDSADKIKELNSILKELNDGGLSNDSIEKIISDYPELIGYIGDEVKLRTELKKKIAEEENKYKQSLRNKVMASSSFAELVESKNQELFKELGLAYNKDTQKFELESRRKAAIAIKDATTAANAWAQIYADEQVLSAPDYSKDLHDAGKNSKYRDKDGNWHFETYNDGKLKTWVYEAGSAMARILDSQRELANTDNFDIDFGDDDKSGSDKNEALDNYLKDAENRYKIHQDETKYIQELQWAHDNLTKDEKERLDVIGKINEAYRDLADNRIKDLEHQIDLKKELYGEDYDATAEWTEIQNISHEEADRYREFARRRLGYYDEGTTDEQKAEIDATIEKTDEIQSNQKTWWDAENKKLDFYSKQHENTIRDIEHARDMTLSKDENANVTSFYKQLQDEYHKRAEQLRLLDPEKYKEEIQELERLWWDAQNEMLDYNKQVVDDFFNELQTKLDDSYDIRINRLNSQSSLLSTHFDLVNAIEEEQHNLNKELLEAETVGVRMNEQERESLFTKAEHTRLSGKLNDIMLDISDLQHDYMRDLKKATSDTIEEVTNHYERQYELKMKEYEIVKAELSLAKAQQVLENTENEKSVRTWNGSSWVYEANLQDVINAQEDVENARYELARAQAEEAQQVALNAIDSKADALETEKNKFATAIDEMAEKMSGSGKDITDMLKTIAETDLPTFDAIIQSMGDSIKTALNISDDDIDSIRRSGGGVAITSDAIEQMKANSAAWHTADKDTQTKLSNANKAWGDALGLDYEDSTGRWKKKDGTYAYAMGTKNAKKGAGLFDEDGFGSEVILTNGGILTQFNGGERVFSPEMADRLWEMAQQNYTFTPMITQPDIGKLIPIEDKINNAISNISNAFGDTYMIKDVQLNESEGGTLKGFINFLKKKI